MKCIDALASHDITYVGVIQTAKALGMTEFPVPYVQQMHPLVSSTSFSSVRSR